MRIQNNDNVAFNASRIMSVQRYLKNGTCETADMFKLDSIEDKMFIQKCNSILANKLTRNLEPLQKRLKHFFREFLTENNPLKSYFLLFNDGEMISGGMTCEKIGKKTHILEAFSNRPKSTNTDNLLYGFLNFLEKEHSETSVISYGHIDKIKNKMELLPQEFRSVKNSIRRSYASSYYDNPSSIKKSRIDLDEFLGTKDFEIDIL